MMKENDGVVTHYPFRYDESALGSGSIRYYYADGQLISFERSSEYGDAYVRRFVLRDHPSTPLRTGLGSTNVIVNGSGTTIAKDLYLPGACPERHSQNVSRRGDVRYQWRTGSPPIAAQTQYRYTGQRMETGVGAPSPMGGLDRGVVFLWRSLV